MQSSSPTATANTKLRVSSPVARRNRVESFHRLFESSSPRKRQSLLSINVRKRNFFGIGDIIRVMTNPAETIRSLTESRRLLEEARREIDENRERAQIRPKHTFSRLPGFFPRPAEILAIERALEGEPSFTVLFGASSVGKTAILREVLSKETYHVLHFDLRIAGFADLSSLYFSLSQQMELYFEEIASTLPGYGEFEKEAWTFKHDRLHVEKRNSDKPNGPEVKTSDLARLMELFQSSLLKYWEFQPADDEMSSDLSKLRQSSDSSVHTRIDPDSPTSPTKRKARWWRFKGKEKEKRTSIEEPKDKEKTKPKKKMPVLFFDEAHKLPTLVQSMEAMKCLLDSMLALTKQDRLCHVIHATSDPFYQTWLRQLNIMQHCKIITIGDCSKVETKNFFRERIVPRVPERLRPRLDFETLYDAFGGKLAHWQDYITDFVNSNGQLEIKQSSHFLQAHSLLNLHVIHSSQSSPPPVASQPQPNARRPASGNLDDPVHPSLGPASFRIYSPASNVAGPPSSFAAMSGASDDRTTAMVAGYYAADFTAMQLLKVMSRLTQDNTRYLPYFILCRELGVRAVDGMVKGRILELRWTDTVTREHIEADEPRYRHVPTPAPSFGPRFSTMPEGSIMEDTDIVPITPGNVPRMLGLGDETAPDYWESEMVGPKLVAATPIMRHAMGEVVKEYEDEQSTSEYASLTDVDEY